MQSNLSSSMVSSKNKRVVWVVAAVVIVAAVLGWWYMYRLAPTSDKAPTSGEMQEPLSGGDTTADIGQDLETVDLGNVDSELDALDQDINQL